MLELHDLGDHPHWIDEQDPMGELEENLERLTLEIPDASIYDLLMHY